MSDADVSREGLTRERLWPPTRLVVRCQDLELRYIDDELVFDLARLAARGVHPPDQMPFAFPWSVGTPLQVARSLLAYQWGVRGQQGPDNFCLEFALVRDKGGKREVLGVQALQAKDYAVTRTAESGSWLGQEYQAQGIGRRMRHMVLALLFDGLEGERATTSAFSDNGPSNAITRRLGYSFEGVTVVSRGAAPAALNMYSLTRETYATSARPHIDIEGAERVRDMLLGDEPSTLPDI